MQAHLKLMQRVYREVPDFIIRNVHMSSGLKNPNHINAQNRFHVFALFPATTKMTVFFTHCRPDSRTPITT